MTRTSTLYLEGVDHCEQVLYLVTGTGIPAALDTLEASADTRELMGHPAEFIRGVRETVATLRVHYGFERGKTEYYSSAPGYTKFN